MTAGGAVIPGPPQPDRAQHGAEALGPVGHELCLVASPAAHPRATVATVQPQQVFQQPRAQPGHGGADRQLHRLQATTGPQRPRCQRGQPLYFGGGIRRERRAELGEEPPFSLPGPAGGSPVAGVTGRASQIASFTATICSESAANCR